MGIEELCEGFSLCNFWNFHTQENLYNAFSVKLTYITGQTLQLNIDFNGKLIFFFK